MLFRSKTRGMHNLAEMLMSTRVPMEVHERQDLVYIKTKPAGAMVRVGRDTLGGFTPMALDRVVVESRPIILLKKGFEPYRLKHLPEDESDIIYIELQHLVPQFGHVAYEAPVPEGIVIVSADGASRFLVEEGAIEYEKLDAGSYHLESGHYIIHNGDFRIRHRRTTHRSEEHTSELQSQAYLVCRLLLEKKNNLPLENFNVVRSMIYSSFNLKLFSSS